MKRHTSAQAHIKTADQVREEFNRIGKPISQWARERGYKPNLVFEVLRGRILCKRGKSHEIAVLLGMKEGEIQRAGGLAVVKGTARP